MDSSTGEVTLLLRAWHAGDEDAYRRLSSLLYQELRERAAKYLRRRRGADLLQTTALVHETFVRLTGAGNVDWQDRRHFLAVAGRTMRRVPVDLFREHVAVKRGGGAYACAARARRGGHGLAHSRSGGTRRGFDPAGRASNRGRFRSSSCGSLRA